MEKEFGKTRYSSAYARSLSKKYDHFSLPSPKFFTGYFGYKFIWYLSQPFSEWKAFKDGIIDEDGNEKRKPKGNEERETYNYYVKLVIRLKQLISRQIDKARAKLIFDRLFLVRENAMDDIDDKLEFFLTEMDKTDCKELHTLIESTVSAGMAMIGGGISTNTDNGVVKRFRAWLKDKPKKKKNKKK